MISESILEGEKVRLRPVQERDLPLFTQWLQDAEVRRWLASIAEPPTLEDEYEWYDGMRSNENAVTWSVDLLEGRLLGTVELRLTSDHHRAELGIAIMDKSAWNQGIGTETVQLLLKYAFDELELNRVDLTTDEDNMRGRRCYEKCGFVEEGLLRQHRFVEGKFGNTVVMSILREEWQAR